MDDPWGSPWADEAAFAPPDQKHVLPTPTLVEESPRKSQGSIWDVDGSYGIWDQPDPVEEARPQASVLTISNGGGSSNEDFEWDSITPKASEFQGDLIDSQLGIEASPHIEKVSESSTALQDVDCFDSRATSAETSGTELLRKDDQTATFPTLEEVTIKDNNISLKAHPDPASTEVPVPESHRQDELPVASSSGRDDKDGELTSHETAPSNPSTSKRSSTISSQDGQNDIAASSKTSFDIENRSVKTPTETAETEKEDAPNAELGKSSIDLPSSDDGRLSTAETISPSKPSDEQLEDEDADFGDFEEETTEIPLDPISTTESSSLEASSVKDNNDIHHSDVSSREPPVFVIDYSSVSDLFNKNIALAEPAKDYDLMNDFSTVEQRKTWYRISRYGSMRKHNLGNDESYTRIRWPNSKTRDATLNIVARWMNEGRIGGVPALIGAGNSRSGTLFGWGESGTSSPVDMASIWASRRSSPQPPPSKNNTPANSKPSTPRIDTFMSPPTVHKIVEPERAKSEKHVSSLPVSQDDSQFAWSTPDVTSPISKPMESTNLPNTAQPPISPTSGSLELNKPPSKTSTPSPLIAPKAFHAPKPNSLLQQAASKRISLNLPTTSSPNMGHRPSTSMVNIPHIVQPTNYTIASPVKAHVTGSEELKGLGVSMGPAESRVPEKQTQILPDTFPVPEQQHASNAEEDDDEWGDMVESAPPTPADFKFPPSPTFAWSVSTTKDNLAPPPAPSSSLSQNPFSQPSVKMHKPSMSLAVPSSSPLYTPPSPTLLQPNDSFRGHKPSMSVGGIFSASRRRDSISPVRDHHDISPSYVMPSPVTPQSNTSLMGHRPSMSVGGVRPPPERRLSKSPVDLRYGGSSDFTVPSPSALRPNNAFKMHKPSMSVGGVSSSTPDHQLSRSRSPVDLRYGALQSEVDAIMSTPSIGNRRTSTTISKVPDLLIDMGADYKPPRPPPSQLVATMEARRAHKHSASVGGMQTYSRYDPPSFVKGHKPAASFDEILSPTRDFLSSFPGLSPIPSPNTGDLYSPSIASPSDPMATAAPGDFSLFGGLGDLPDSIAEHLSPVAETSPPPWKVKTQAQELQERDDDIVRKIIGDLPDFSYMLKRG